MGAALLPLLKTGMGLAGSAGLIPRPGADPAITTVKIGRAIYVGSATYIAALWYFGWRNERVDAGSGKFPIPGLFKGDITNPGGAADADLPADATPGNVFQTDPTPPTPLQNLGTLPAPRGNLTTNAALLDYIGRVAPNFGLKATENPKFGGVTPGAHTPTSWHYKGRAIDFVSPTNNLNNLSTFAAWLDANYRAQLLELIWAGPGPKAVKNGASVPSTVFASVWANHKTHVHVAI